MTVLSLLVLCLLETSSSNQRVGLDKKKRKTYLQDMFFCGKTDAERYQVIHFLFLKETVEEMRMGDSGFLALLWEPQNPGFFSPLSKQKQATMGTKLLGTCLKSSAPNS